jgi:hypothetical protein
MENAKVDGKSLYPANSMDYAELKKWLDPAQRSNLCFGKWYLSSSPDKKEGRIARQQHVLLGAFTPSNLGRTIVSLRYRAPIRVDKALREKLVHHVTECQCFMEGIVPSYICHINIPPCILCGFFLIVSLRLC